VFVGSYGLEARGNALPQHGTSAWTYAI